MTAAPHITPFGPEGPELTFPQKVGDVVCAAYERASVIVEYGSGGSTAFGASRAGKTLYSVEGSRDWHGAMEAHFAARPPQADLHLIYEDVGPTADWAWPKGNGKWFRYPDYCFGVWQRPDLKAPDLVLIDGRFRMGCFFATWVSIPRPVTVLFDDYKGRRDRYGLIEEFVPVTAMHGRMAEFALAPVDHLPASALYPLLKAFQEKA
ncbi:hypothetical protein [Celeribacter indicus]|uniref:Class I SAM-dependent methyltransferase n=1 Tax=Celeribacter indicus TaxID=1208324 RepID=A0A0B5DUE8_9RHOB|nr:hypothetical protein [Celeribacter indicus]AJE47068.1 hypothetical protein P73_2353 [Celeribacter indicus]SDW91723.1 hypothetical protein SAMN05443573_10983 [Celeribacter indicus]